MPKTFHNNFHTYSIARKQDPYRTTNTNGYISHIQTEKDRKQRNKRFPSIKLYVS